MTLADWWGTEVFQLPDIGRLPAALRCTLTNAARQSLPRLLVKEIIAFWAESLAVNDEQRRVAEEFGVSI